MPILQAESGEMRFSDDFVFSPENAPAQTDGIVNLGTHPVEEASFQLFYHCDGTGGRMLWLLPLSAALGGERALLMNVLGLKEPPAAELPSFAVRFPFGTLTLSADPFTGRSEAFFRYPAAKEGGTPA